MCGEGELNEAAVFNQSMNNSHLETGKTVWGSIPIHKLSSRFGSRGAS